MDLTVGDFVGWDCNGASAMGQVLSVHSEGAVPVAYPITATPDSPVALVQVWRDGIASDALVGVPTRMLRKEDLADRFSMGTPTPDKLKLINALLPTGARPLTDAEVITVSFVAADNLLTHSLMKWSLDSLRTMAQVLIGRPTSLDHDWDEVCNIWGRIYDARFVAAPVPTMAELDQSGNRDLNLQIIKADGGYFQVIFDAFATLDSPVVSGLMSARLNEVSAGLFRFRDYLCPICDRSFFDPQEPHGIPGVSYGDASYAPYAIRDGLYYVGEVSLVTSPNNPMAGVT